MKVQITLFMLVTLLMLLTLETGMYMSFGVGDPPRQEPVTTRFVRHPMTRLARPNTDARRTYAEHLDEFLRKAQP
jgi:hypothetical protein